MLDYFLKFLAAELEGRASSPTSIEWGTEAVRLQAPAPFIKSIVEAGRLPNMTPNTESVKKDTARQENEASESAVSGL